MAKRDSFLLRIDPQVLAEVRRWADDDMRSVNTQIEFLLRQSLRKAGRLTKRSKVDAESHEDEIVDRDK
jgi:hypothetical protein